MRALFSRQFESIGTLGALTLATMVGSAVLVQGDGPQPTPEGFVALFNGVDLKGWKQVQGKPGTFTVNDGAIFGHRPSKAFAYWLSTEEKYGDYELRLEYWLPTGGNTGVFIRVPDHLPRTSKKGMEVQLMDDGDRKTPDKSSTASLYNGIAAQVLPKQKLDDWNSITVICQGSHVVVFINGVKVNDADMDSSETLKNRPHEGYIGLSAHTKDVRFRNIFLRKLPPSRGVQTIGKKAS